MNEQTTLKNLKKQVWMKNFHARQVFAGIIFSKAAAKGGYE
jgi:hypothetical protein